MSDRVTRWAGTTLLHHALIIGLLAPLAACHSRNTPKDPLLSRISQKIHPLQPSPPIPGKMATDGSNLITTECAVQSYANASKGLIASETGLHEDVFSLRDRTSYQSNVYSLDEALKLEALLLTQTKTPGSPAEQSDCILLFAQHFETITDPLVQQDKELKELDVSAFNDSRKEAEQQLEKTTPDPNDSTPH